MEAGGFKRVNLFTVRHIWTFVHPNVVYEATAAALPAFAAILERQGEERREAFRAAIADAIRHEQGEGPYGLEGEAYIAMGVK